MSTHPKIDFRNRESKRKDLEGLRITNVCPPHHSTPFLLLRPSITRPGIEWLRRGLAQGFFFVVFFRVVVAFIGGPGAGASSSPASLKPSASDGGRGAVKTWAPDGSVASNPEGGGGASITDAEVTAEADCQSGGGGTLPVDTAALATPAVASGGGGPSAAALATSSKPASPGGGGAAAVPAAAAKPASVARPLTGTAISILISEFMSLSPMPR